MYHENPKTKGSGILCAIPQKGTCPVGCADCFFQSGRSYLEPLDENTPNMPDPASVGNRVVRVNDGNDSNHHREDVIEATACYPMRFFNTSIPKDLAGFPAPVVLTVNPGKRTDADPVLLPTIPSNLMFVRIRTNTWNLETVDRAVGWYGLQGVPIVLTFMAYHYIEDIPTEHIGNYLYRKRTTNSYFAITTQTWRQVMDQHRNNPWVYSCGKIEGENGTTACKRCGNCLREYFATVERMRG